MEETIYRLTVADAEAFAGRKVTPEEVERIKKALEFSTMPEVVQDVIWAVTREELTDED